MQKLEPIIKNSFNEKLDTWVEIPEGEVKANIIMVHGFGTSKHETARYFDDISTALVSDNFRVIRFDFSGYGKSEGRQVEVCYTKQIEDLKAIHQHVTSNYNEPIYIFAQSMGTWVTALASLPNIIKTIMTGIPNTNTQVIIDRFIARFGKRDGAVFDVNGVSLLPRSTGKIQKIGPQFWEDIRNLKPVEVVTNYSRITDLHIFHWDNDEIIGRDYLSDYDAIPTIKSYWMPGDHSLTNPPDRANFITKMLDIYNH